MQTYILKGKTPVPAGHYEWAEYMNIAEKDQLYRHVALYEYYIDDKQYCNLSTVFLGIDHGFNSEVPILFESLVFQGSMDQTMERYSTWDAAEIGHALLHGTIFRAITHSFPVESITEKFDEYKTTRYRFRLRICGFVPANKESGRLIRED